jgi:hypothetical protein
VLAARDAVAVVGLVAVAQAVAAGADERHDGGDAALGVVLEDLALGEPLVGDDRLRAAAERLLELLVELGVDVVLLAA